MFTNKELASQTLALLRSNNIDCSISILGKIFKSLKFDYKNLFYLHLSSDFKTLLTCDIGLSKKEVEWEFGVMDFSHPFSHVIQSRNVRKIDYSQLISWDNYCFQELLKKSKIVQDESYIIFPLYHEQKKSVIGLFVLHVPREMELSLYNDMFLWILNVFSIHISNLEHFQYILNERKSLIFSIKNNKIERGKERIFYQISSNIIGNSKGMQNLFNQMAQVAPTVLSVLISGDTGVGKEVVARMIHKVSNRGTKPFIAVNCASIPAHLFESEIFGHIKGAFTGAENDRQGLVALADTGTLFLDEIGDMPLEIQSKLLRVLETKKYRPLGSDIEKISDFRIVAATHIDLKEAILLKEFRADLYYRIAQYVLHVPALIERVDDIPLLVNYFIDYFNQNNNIEIKGIEESALEQLMQFNYEGNVRELRGIVLTCCSLTTSSWITSNVITEYLNISDNSSNKMNKAVADIVAAENRKSIDEKNFLLEVLKNGGGLSQAIGFLEKELVLIGLDKYDFNRKQTADFLQIPLRTLSHKCQVYDLSKFRD